MGRDDLKHRRGLSAAQKRTLLWLPVAGLWLLLLVVSKSPEGGGRDWPSFFTMGLVGSAVYAVVWSGLIRLTTPREGPPPTTAESLAQGKSRAKLIYGNGPRSGSDPDSDDEGT